MTTEQHFFSEAPHVSWWEWLKRKSLGVFLSPIEPRWISSNFAGNPIPKSITQTVPTKASPKNSAEYSQFLQRYFYPSSAPIELCIPATTLSMLLESQTVIGAEIRNTSKQLIGCVFDIYAGHILGKPTGLVTWFCIHPDWRKKGIGSVLLFALYKFSQPRKIHWWRNDMSLQSPLPPVYTELHLVRSKYCIQTSISSPKYVHLTRSSLQVWKEDFKQTWLKKNPAGLCLENPATLGASEFPNGNPAITGNTTITGNTAITLQEVWEAKFSKMRTVAILIQPTYEIQRNQQIRYCEILAYAWKDEPKTEYEQAVLLERMLDQLPYERFEISISFPHLEHGWISTGQTSWSCIGLDPGNPVQRPLLPLCCA
jgi:GNAT superfamily N-acetyltransferase